MSTVGFLTETGLLPGKRIVALDAGARSIRLLLAESVLKRVRVLQCDSIHLDEEGLVSPEELNRHLRQVLEEWGAELLAIPLAQHMALCQLIEVADAAGQDVAGQIEAETLKLSGLSESTVIYDYSPLQPVGRFRRPYWVTLCQESEISRQTEQLGVSRDELCEVTTQANALLAACRETHPELKTVLVVDARSASTTAAIQVDGQPVYANSFPMGGDLFLEALARGLGTDIPTAVEHHRTHDVLSGENPPAEFAEAVHGWLEELQRIFLEWQGDMGLAMRLTEMPVLVCGSAFQQKGLLEYMRGVTHWDVRLWEATREEAPWTSGTYAAAYGTVLQALGRNEYSATLLPADLREACQRQWSLHLWHSILFVCVLAGLLVMGAATIETWQTIREKEVLLEQAREAVSAAKETEQVARQAVERYERIRPVLKAQRQTADTLATLAAIERTKANQNFWYVLFGDAQSYFSEPVSETATNSSPASLPREDWEELDMPVASVEHAFIAELSVPAEGEAMRRTLTMVVSELNESPLFRNVDSLPGELQRPLVNPAVIIPERHFALVLRLAENEFRKPLLPVMEKSQPAAREQRAGKTFRERAEATLERQEKAGGEESR